MADVLVDTSSSSPAQLLAQGIKAYVLQDFNTAVTALSKASELLVAEHGDDLHDSLADVYLYYGKALLGLSREENGALGDAVPRNNEEDSEDDEDEQAENCEDNGEENEKAENDEKVENDEMAETEEQEKADGAPDEPTNGVTSSTDDTSKAEASASTTAADAKKDDDDDPTDLQLAWEVLELAKKIFQRRGGDAGLQSLADTLTVLGEVSLESENFDAAVADIEEGLQIQQRLLGPESRTVAETFYKLGVAQSAGSQTEAAMRSFEGSLDCLRRRAARLREEGGSEEEVGEIEGLVPDLEEKIADMKSYKEEALKKIVSAVTEAKSSDGASTSSAVETKPVTNISHLVKRKRKADEMTDEKEISGDNPVKKLNQ